MENDEVETLLVEDDVLESEKTIDILRKNKLTDKLLHLKNGTEANDFIFCTGVYEKRDFTKQPKAILYNVKLLKFVDIDFLNRLAAYERTKNIPLTVSSLEYEALVQHKDSN